MSHQQTIASPIHLNGIGLHSGREMNITIYPAPIHFGVKFRRIDLPDRPELAGHAGHLVDSFLATTLGDERMRVGTVEHLMAALVAMEIDNALVELDGPEVPVLDGSALGWVRAIESVGVRRLPAPRLQLKILKPVSVTREDRKAEILPNGGGFEAECHIDFSSPFIGEQTYSFRLTPERFAREIAPARTFGFMHEVQNMRSHGLALGGSPDNAIILGEDGILNEEGLRFPDEFVRHKALDVIGDLALIGFPVAGRWKSHKSGHALNLALVHAILMDRTAYRIEEAPDNLAFFRPPQQEVPLRPWARAQ